MRFRAPKLGHVPSECTLKARLTPVMATKAILYPTKGHRSPILDPYMLGESSGFL